MGVWNKKQSIQQRIFEKILSFFLSPLENEELFDIFISS